MAEGDMQQAWHRLSADDVLQELDADRDGLSSDEAESRLEEHGENQIGEQKKVSPGHVLLHQFQSPLIYVLLAALAVTLAIQSWSDAIVIGAVLVINGTIGFLQEYRAERAVEALMQMIAPKARVRRDGQEQNVRSNKIVPGDLVLLSEGQVVPADIRLLEVKSLQVNEAPLTGESVPVNKTADAMEDAEEDLPPAEQENTAFMGTSVTSGSGTGVVVATGQQTQIGEIAREVQEADETTSPLQRRINQLAKYIAVGILLISGAAFGVGWWMGRDLYEMLLLAVALAVAAIPAGLPIVVTVALAIGVRRMAKRHAVIRHLPAVDTLGSCTTIVSDKTGTLTQNRMSVQAIVAGDSRYEVTGETHTREGVIEHEGEAIDELSEHTALHQALLAGALCNNARIEERQEEANEEEDAEDDSGDDEKETAPGDPMEVALLYAGLKAGLDRQTLDEHYPRQDEVPFKTERRFMATIHDVRDSNIFEGDESVVFVKGAPETIVGMCDRAADDAELDADAIIEQSEALAGEGLRVLAMAMGRGQEAIDAVQRGEPSGLTFLGLQGMLDPPRPSAVEAVDQCHEAGIRVIMVTGDHARTAAAIAHETHVDRPVSIRRDDDRDADRDSEQDASPEVRVRYDVPDEEDASADEIASRFAVDAQIGQDQRLRVVLDINPGDEAEPNQKQTDAQAQTSGKTAPSGLPTAHTGREVDDADDDRLDQMLDDNTVFARVQPQQKLRIVDRLKARYEIVAVTGDGVNDAPALKNAHLGAAMGSGTDVAKEASDMVITDDNFASVYSAVEEGRTAFRNIRMATFFLLSTGAADVILILASLGLRWPLPLLPTQILWCNVVTNGIADVALAFEPGEKALYHRPPRPPSEGVLDRRLLERLVLVGVWLAAGTLGMFYLIWDGKSENLDLARTAALTTLVLFQKVHVFNCRSEDVSIFRKSPLKNKVLLGGVLASLAVHIAAVYLPWSQQLLDLVPLDAKHWAIATGIAATAILVNEGHKWLRSRGRSER